MVIKKKNIVYSFLKMSENWNENRRDRDLTLLLQAITQNLKVLTSVNNSNVKAYGTKNKPPGQFVAAMKQKFGGTVITVTFSQ